MEGVLPGGGVALLACHPVLQQMLDQSTDTNERAAYRILMKAMEEPTRTIVANAGHDAYEVMAQIKQAGAFDGAQDRPSYGFDVTLGQIVDMMQAGIWDAAIVQKSAIYAAISSAAQALTIDVLIHRQEQPEQATIRAPSKRKRL